MSKKGKLRYQHAYFDRKRSCGNLVQGRRIIANGTLETDAELIISRYNRFEGQRNKALFKETKNEQD